MATIINVNGAIVSRNTTYEGNSGESVITSTGATSIQESCFVHNNVTSGVVQIADAALLISDSAFYGNGNIAEAADGCSGIYAESDGSCTESTATSCAIASLDSDSFAPSLPAGEPSVFPSLAPSIQPTNDTLMSLPTNLPSISYSPSVVPSLNQTSSISPSVSPSLVPSYFPSLNQTSSFPPSIVPSSIPSMLPSLNQTSSFPPSMIPSLFPSYSPSHNETSSFRPSLVPSLVPSYSPSFNQTSSFPPSIVPSLVPSYRPSVNQTSSSTPSIAPPLVPSYPPSFNQTSSSTPSIMPSLVPSYLPSINQTSSSNPSIVPSLVPSNFPSYDPSSSIFPSVVPYTNSSNFPSRHPSSSLSPSISSPPSNVRSLNLTLSFFPSIFFAPPSEVQTASLSPSMAPSSSLVPSAISSSNASLIPSALNETLSPLNQSLVPSMAPSETSSQNNSIADPPASNDTDVCISGFDALLEGLNDDNSSGTFKFCNTTVVDFSGGQEPLLISTSNVIIDCPSCVFRGGDEHIVLQGSVSNVTFRGISFIDAGSRSIFANLSAPSSIVFEECTWTDNRGSAAIWLDNMDYVPLPESAQVADSIGTDKDDDLFPGRLLQDDSSSVSFACDQCVFDLNNGRDGILVSSGVSLDLSRVRFDSNQAEGAIINAKNVAVDISSSCFVENRYGKRLLDADFTLALSDLNFGANNTKTGGLEPCDGLGSAVICLPFEATACFDFVSDTNSTDSTNSTNSTMPPITNSSCVNNWDSLADAFEAATPGNKTVLMICENATLEVGEPIIIASDAAVQCGIGGSSGNNCTITGGITHFILKGVAMSVSFAGIAFEKAEVISVRAFGSNESRAIFSDCSWKSHFGPAAVLVYNEIDGLKYTDENIERLASSDSHAMKTTFENCYFHDNEPSFAAIAVVDGRVDVISSAFEQNELMTAGVIAGTMGTELSLFSSCFIRNQALTSGTVYLDSLSELVKHDRLLFGDTNVAGTDTDCQDVLESTLDTCLIDGICTGFCTAFEAGTCNLPFLNSSSADEQTNPPNENRNSSSSSNGTDVVTELKPLSFKRASPNILIIVNILIIILTLIGGFIMYYRCTKKHSDPHLPKDGAPPSPETTDLLGNLGGKFGFGKKALSTVAETNEEESGDDESGDDESVFADEVAKESRPAVTKDVSASNLSTMSGMFGGIRQFEEEDSDSDEESAAFLGSKSESNNSLMLGHSSGKIKKKKKLRVIKKIKRTINKGKKEDEAEPTTAGSESNLTLSRGRSYGSAFDNSTSSDVFGEDYDLGSMFS